MSTSTVVWIQFAFFILSVAIAMISVIAGIGGGVIFTPIMLAFTGVNSIVIRGTGLVVAMFSGLISTGIFIKKGLSNYKLAMILTISQAVGALSGALLAVAAAESSGVTGEGLMRAGLGLILLLIAVYFLIGGRKIENPTVTTVDRFTGWLGLDGSYYEQSEGRTKSYRVKRAPLGLLLIFFVGVIGGFFGMGGGWAITPVLNMGMGVPLKLAAGELGRDPRRGELRFDLALHIRRRHYPVFRAAVAGRTGDRRICRVLCARQDQGAYRASDSDRHYGLHMLRPDHEGTVSARRDAEPVFHGAADSVCSDHRGCDCGDGIR